MLFNYIMGFPRRIFRIVFGIILMTFGMLWAGLTVHEDYEAFSKEKSSNLIKDMENYDGKKYFWQ